MSQYEARIILLELGGVATTTEMKEKAREKFPHSTLHMYIGQRLRKMEEWGEVSSELIIRKGSKGKVKKWTLLK
jgi:hypothetical protein